MVGYRNPHLGLQKAVTCVGLGNANGSVEPELPVSKTMKVVDTLQHRSTIGLG